MAAVGRKILRCRRMREDRELYLFLLFLSINGTFAGVGGLTSLTVT
jgi:hypothetical protein